MVKNNKIKTGKKFKLHNEIYFIGIIGLISCIFFGINLYKNQSDVRKVIVYVNGEIDKEISLLENQTITVNGEDGAYNIIVIEEGEVFMKEASCPDHICEQMGHISKSGESITCLPNKVVVEIKGDDTQERLDSVVR